MIALECKKSAKSYNYRLLKMVFKPKYSLCLVAFKHEIF